MDDSTPQPPYHTPARLACTALLRAMEEAKALLPAAVLQAHWIAGHHSPAAWKSVEAHFRCEDEQPRHVLAMLTDLALMAEALACLGSVLTEPTTTGSLRLAKQKRVEL